MDYKIKYYKYKNKYLNLKNIYGGNLDIIPVLDLYEFEIINKDKQRNTQYNLNNFIDQIDDGTCGSIAELGSTPEDSDNNPATCDILTDTEHFGMCGDFDINKIGD